MFLFFSIDNKKNEKLYKDFVVIVKKRKLVGKIEEIKKYKLFFHTEWNGNDNIFVNKPKIFKIYNVLSPSYNTISFLVNSIYTPRGKREVEVDIRSKLYNNDIEVYNDVIVDNILDITEKNYKDIHNVIIHKPIWTDYRKFIKIYTSKKKFRTQLDTYNILKKLHLRCPDLIDYEIIDTEYILITNYRGISFNTYYDSIDHLPPSIYDLIMGYNEIVEKHNYKLNLDIRYFSMYDGFLHYLGKIYEIKN